jgi:hypothetical protein
LPTCLFAQPNGMGYFCAFAGRMVNNRQIKQIAGIPALRSSVRFIAILLRVNEPVIAGKFLDSG